MSIVKPDPGGRLGTAKVTFDVLFNMLVALGIDYKVVTRKAA
jgi:hypothetical protein